MSDKLYVITTFFNPANFKSLLRNYYIFRENLLKSKNVELLTVELSFNGEFQIVGDNVFRLYSDSVMWQKERLINYGISKLPSDCRFFGWFDCDILFLNQDWAEISIDILKKGAIITQPFKKVYFAPKNEAEFSPFYKCQQGVLWQYKIHKNWLERRKSKELGFSSPGFAWCVNSDEFKRVGLYDRCITGSADTFLVDCLLGSNDIHGYSSKTTKSMDLDMDLYRDKVKSFGLRIDYSPVDVLHLYHGSIPNRNYMSRHEILQKHEYDPKTDIKLENDVFEWDSDKVGMHEDIKRYFFDRKEDE